MKSKTKYRCPKCSCRMFPGVRPLSVSLPDKLLSDPSGVVYIRDRTATRIRRPAPELERRPHNIVARFFQEGGSD
jgi:hypothetical protein